LLDPLEECHQELVDHLQATRVPLQGGQGSLQDLGQVLSQDPWRPFRPV